MVATPPEEILKQHQEACQRVKAGQAYMTPCVCGEIPLRYKQQPVSYNPESIGIPEEWNGCISTRGHVDVTSLANLIRVGYNDLRPHNKKTARNKSKSSPQKSSSPTTVVVAPNGINRNNLWDPRNATQHNVAVTRPSHDGWGIGKIVLMFCDDFLTKVYEMPWWHMFPEMQTELEPIFHLLDINPNQVVRCLFANLPPQTTIPVHYDSGTWVTRTHRVHVPILVRNPNDVVFTCGPNPQEMDRIPCTPGHVFEINNQAHHAVSNCSPKEHRVHLILDYVELPCRHDRIPLQPGEVLVQTRRSIDRQVADYGKRPTPTFLILGAQKAGTTSLYNYMMQHPLVIPAKRRETHNLDWRWNYNLTTTKKQLQHVLQFYHHHELQRHASCLTGDSTPSYLLDAPRVVRHLKQIYSHALDMKFFVLTRNPVDRAVSHYAMVTSTEGTSQQLKTRGKEWRSKTLQQVIQEEFQLLHDYGVIPYWNIDNHTMNVDVWNEFISTPQERQAWNVYLERTIPLHTGSHSLLARGLYALQIQTWLQHFDAKQFMILNLEDLQDTQETMGRVWKHLELPNYDIQNAKAQNQRSYNANKLLTDEMKDVLERFYQPHNARLQQLLSKLDNESHT